MTGPERNPNVSLPNFTRADALEAARLGMTREEYELRIKVRAADARSRSQHRGTSYRDPDPTSNRGRAAKPRPGNIIEINESEYKELCLVAALSKRLLPLLEQTSAPVTHHGEFEALRESLERITLYGWATTGTEAAVGDLLGILNATR